MTVSAPTTLTFFVPGRPQTQGNKSGFVYKDKSGKHRAALREGRDSDANERFHSWRTAVADAARKAWGDRPLLLGPIRVSYEFRFHRNEGDYGTGRNARKLKASAVNNQADKKPDLDKLERAVGDALTSVVFKDDRQVCSYLPNHGKVLVHTWEPEGVKVTIEIKEDQP